MADGGGHATRGRGVGARLAGAVERHLQTLVASLGRLARAPFGTLLTIGVIGVALALPAALGLVVANARVLSGSWRDALNLTVYLKPALPAADARQLAEQLAARADVTRARLVTPQQGLADFRRWSGLGAALDALKDNPLPAVVVVEPRLNGDEADARSLPALADRLRALPGVDQVQLDTAWVQRFTSILDGLRRAGLLIGGLLAIAVLLIVSNTIRLDIDGRRAEVEVAKLVGASDRFVRRPFLYGGFWFGAGGGCVAWLLVEGLVLALAGPVERIASAYGTNFAISGLDAADSLRLILGGAALGWVGAYLSATRHLRAIEPGVDG